MKLGYASLVVGVGWWVAHPRTGCAGSTPPVRHLRRQGGVRNAPHTTHHAPRTERSEAS